MSDGPATMPDDTSTQSPITTPPAAPADTGSGSGGPVQAELEARFAAAASQPDVAGTSPSPQPKRRPGQRGPDKAPRRRPGKAAEPDPVDPDELFTERGTSPVAGPVVTPIVALPPPPDDKALRVGIEGLVRLLEGGAALYLAKAAHDANAGEAITRRVIEQSKPTPEVRDSIVNGSVECWKKYFPNTPIGPEVELIGALGLWIKQLNDLRMELRAMRDRVVPA